ncbi:MAG: Ni/Fe-hydrogenase cytochrome b subunit [Gammaproteobacteria bacterium]
MSKHQPAGGRILTLPFLFFSLLALIGVYFIVQRFLGGLGSVTALNNGYPWGIWVVGDIVIGTAFACGGYALALVVYVANKRQYHPLMRPALLGSLLGYTLGGVAAFVDMGRYLNFYHMFLPNSVNLNSVMLEVGLCVMAYVVVLWIEFTPTFLERFKAEGLQKTLNRVLFLFVAIGILLPTMHQSSLGSLLIAAGGKIDPLWQANELLPALFLITAIGMGFSIVVFEGALSTLRFRLPSEVPLYERLAGIIVALLGAFLVLRFGELVVNGKLGRAFAGDFRSVMFWLETILYVIPIVVMASARNRRSQRLLFLAAVTMLLGASLYRINAFLVAFNAPGGYHYFPSASELMVTVGMFSIEVVVFLYVIKRFPVLPRAEHA